MMNRCSHQPGDFYGGWITGDIVGPFKGGSGTWAGNPPKPLTVYGVGFLSSRIEFSAS